MTSSIILELEITLDGGLHTRPSAKLAALATRHHVACTIFYENKQANALSILECISLMVPKGGKVSFEISGEDAQEFAEDIHAILSPSLL